MSVVPHSENGCYPELDAAEPFSPELGIVGQDPIVPERLSIKCRLEVFADSLGLGARSEWSTGAISLANGSCARRISDQVSGSGFCIRSGITQRKNGLINLGKTGLKVSRIALAA